VALLAALCGHLAMPGPQAGWPKNPGGGSCFLRGFPVVRGGPIVSLTGSVSLGCGDGRGRKRARARGTATVATTWPLIRHRCGWPVFTVGEPHCDMCRWLGHRTCDLCGGVALSPAARPDGVELCGYCDQGDAPDSLPVEPGSPA
jgi:hypothetical protein